MNNKEYGVELNVDISKFHENLKKAKTIADETKKDIEKSLEKIKINNEQKQINLSTSISGTGIEQISKKYDILMSKYKKGQNDLELVGNSLQRESDLLTDLQVKASLLNKEYEKAKQNIQTQKDLIKSMTTGYTAEGFATYNKEDASKWNRAYIDMYASERKMLELNPEIKKAEDLVAKQADKVDMLSHKYNNLTESTKNYEVELERIANTTPNVNDNLKAIKENTENLKNNFANFGNIVSNSIKRGVSDLKRFTFSLIGVRSLYTALSRAVNSYMAYDDKLNAKIKANWIALGAMFAPIVEKIIGLFQKLVAYINVFWKALTGKNLIEIALSKVEKKANKTKKAVKELNKELSNIDEIVNLNFDNLGGNDIDTDIGDNGIADALKEIQNLQLNENIVKVLEWLAQKVKDLYNWGIKVKNKLDEWGISIKDIISLIGGIYIAFKIGKIVSGIAQIIGVAGGTAGLYGMITALGIIDVYLGVTLYNKIKELGKAWEQQQDAETRLGNSRIQTMYTVAQQIDEIDKLLAQGIKTDEYGNDLEKKKKNLISEAKKSYATFNQEKKDGVKYSKAQVAEMEEMKKKLEKLTGKKWKTSVDVEMQPTKESKSWWDKFTDGIRGIFVKPNETSGGGGNHFAKGNVAYQPTVAEFGEYAGARSNPEITAPQNMIRETLSQALADVLPTLNNNNGGGDTILYVNGRELARATYSDFKAEGSRLGSSNVAIRRN